MRAASTRAGRKKAERRSHSTVADAKEAAVWPEGKEGRIGRTRGQKREAHDVAGTKSIKERLESHVADKCDQSEREKDCGSREPRSAKEEKSDAERDPDGAVIAQRGDRTHPTVPGARLEGLPDGEKHGKVEVTVEEIDGHGTNQPAG